MQNVNCKLQNSDSPASASLIRLRNATGQARELWLEPLGDRVDLAPNVLYELTATDALEVIDLSVEGFTVHGWVTRVATVNDDGSVQTVWKLHG
jgi:hypothetical protein